jgi:hypothetical protein
MTILKQEVRFSYETQRLAIFFNAVLKKEQGLYDYPGNKK